MQTDAPTVAPPPVEVDTAEAARRLGVHPETIRRAVRRGDLHARQVRQAGRPVWVVTLAALDAFHAQGASHVDDSDTTAREPASRVDDARVGVDNSHTRPRVGVDDARAGVDNSHTTVDALRAHVADLQGEVARLRADLDGARSAVAARSADVGRLVEALAALTTTALPKPEPERRPWWRALIGG